jgi:hypothetical protein
VQCLFRFRLGDADDSGHPHFIEQAPHGPRGIHHAAPQSTLGKPILSDEQERQALTVDEGDSRCIDGHVTR